jgi:hypothetical protein
MSCYLLNTGAEGRTAEVAQPRETVQEARRLALAAGGLVAALAAMAAFTASYIGVFHNPKPHHVRIGVLDERTAAALDASHGAFTAHREPTLVALQADLRSRDIAAALAGRTLYVASGESYTTAATVTAVFSKQIPGLKVVDMAPLQHGDPRGTTLFYLVIASVFGGYLAATLVSLLTGYGFHTRWRAAARIGALALFACLAGLAGASITAGYDAITNHFLAVWWIAALVVFAAAAATVALQTAMGIVGTGIAMVVFIILGNSSAAGPYQLTFAPGFWRAVGPFLPQAPGVSALRGAVYFGGTNIGGRLTVLAIYAALGSIITVAIGRRHGPRADELELAAAASAL